MKLIHARLVSVLIACCLTTSVSPAQQPTERPPAATATPRAIPSGTAKDVEEFRDLINEGDLNSAWELAEKHGFESRLLSLELKGDKQTWPQVAMVGIYTFGYVALVGIGLFGVISLWSMLLGVLAEPTSAKGRAVRLLGDISIDGELTDRGKMVIKGTGMLGTIAIVGLCVLAAWGLHIVSA